MWDFYGADPKLCKALQSHQCPSPVIRDITDGRKYKELKEFTSQGNVTLTVNTDGVQLFKSSTVSMWPIWVMINELPLPMR